MEAFNTYIKSLLYKTVSIYVTSYTSKPLIFSGVLASIDQKQIRLVIQSEVKSNPYKINFSRCFKSSDIVFVKGSLIEIPLSKIEAVLHHPSSVIY